METVREQDWADGAGTEAKLRAANRALRLFSQCNSAVVHATDEDELLSEICRIAVDVAGYPLAWVGRAEHDATRTVSLVTFAGLGEPLRGARVSWADDAYGRGPVGTAIRTERAAIFRNLDQHPSFRVWSELAKQGLAAAIGVPLFVGSEVYGALGIYAAEVNAFDQTEVELLEDLRANISHGITALRAQKARAAADRAAARTLDRLRRAQAIGRIGIWELELSSGATWASDEMFRICGLPVSPDQSFAFADLQRGALPEYQALLAQTLPSIVRERRGAGLEFAIRRAGDGEVVYVDARLDLSLDPAGQPERILGTIQDITGRKQLEQQLVQAQKMESVGRLAGGVAHDFNNLLTVIQSYTGLILDEVGPDHPYGPDLEEIQKAAARAAELTGQLLAFSRRQVLDPRLLNLNDVVVGAERMLRRVIGEDIQLITALAPALGNVLADRGQVEQVIINLAVNARDAMARGGKLTIETQEVELTTEYAAGRPELSPGRYVMTAVTDTGEGMDAGTQSRIFEPFFSTKEGGSGLGLSTVYGVVRQSGGHITVASEPGRGTTFRVYFPRVPDGTTRPISVPPRSGGNAVRVGETILVVEDNEQVRALIGTVLRRAGYRVLSASSPADAVGLAGSHEGAIDLLLTDVVMPGLPGPDLATRVTATRPDTKVLFMSGYADHALVHQGVLERAIAFVAKPLAPSALLAKVREVLDRR